MFKKSLFVLLVLGLLAVAATPALAQGQGPGGQPGRGFHMGEITAIGSDSFTVSNPLGERTVLVTDETVFLNFDGSDAAFSDLQVGRWVGGRATQNEDDTWTAVTVRLLPEDFVPGMFKGPRVGGEVIATSVNSITLQNRRGVEVTVMVNSATEYGGEVANLAAITPGMHAMAIVEEQADGSLLATQIIAGEMGTLMPGGGRPGRGPGHGPGFGPGTCPNCPQNPGG